MGFNPGVQSQAHNGPRKSERRGAFSSPAMAFLILAVVLLVALVGCGTERADNKSTGKSAAQESADSLAARKSVHKRAQGGSASTKRASTKGTTQQSPPVVTRQDTRDAQSNHVVRLTDRRCVQFEPHWSTVAVGHSLTWSNELKQTVTIHVPTGAFDRTDFVVPAGGRVSTGPARKPGLYQVSSEPVSCKGIPRGVQGAGPGLTITGDASGH